MRKASASVARADALFLGQDALDSQHLGNGMSDPRGKLRPPYSQPNQSPSQDDQL
jgi:hypothetical protein